MRGHSNNGNYTGQRCHRAEREPPAQDFTEDQDTHGDTKNRCH